MTEFFMTLTHMSLTAAVIILAVCLLRLCLKKAPKKYAYWLWAVVAFRLVCPVSFPSVLSVFNLSTASTVRTVGPVTEISYLPSAVAQARRAMQAAPDTWSYISNGGFPWERVFQGAVLLWAVGVGAMLIWAAVSYVRTRRRVAAAVKLGGKIYQCDQLGSPFVLGFLKPKIYIPFGLEGNQLDYVLAHEEYHIKRRDYLVKPLAFLILTVHWMNPFVWLAFCLMNRDMELSCDEAVLAGLSEDARRGYSLSLLSFAENKRFPSPNPLAFGETGIKARVKNVMKYHKTAVWVSLAAAAVCIIAVIACATNPSAVASIGIIGGADGPTQIYVGRGGNDQAFSSALLEAFTKTEEEAKAALGLTEDDLIEEKTGMDARGYGKKAVWFGREMETRFWFQKGKPINFMAEEEQPDDQGARDHADTCFQQFVSQFGPPVKCEGYSGSYPYEDGIERELFQSFWENDSKNRLSFTTRLEDGTYLTWGVGKDGDASGMVTFSAVIRRDITGLLEGEDSASSSPVAYEGKHISLTAQEVEAAMDRQIELGASEKTAEDEAVSFLAWQYILAQRAGEAGIDLSQEDYEQAAREEREKTLQADNYQEVMEVLLNGKGMTEDEYWENLPNEPVFQRQVLGTKFLEKLREDFDKTCKEEGLLADWNVYLAEYKKNALADEGLKKIG